MAASSITPPVADPWDAVSTAAPAPTAPAPTAPIQSDPWDAVSTASPADPWDAVSDVAAPPSSKGGMNQAESTFRAQYDAQQAEPWYQKAGDMAGGFLKGKWDTVKDLPALGKAAINPALTMALGPLAGPLAPLAANTVLPPSPTVLPSVAEAGYQVPTGLLKVATDLASYPSRANLQLGSWLFDKITGQTPTPAQKEQKFQEAWLDYLGKNAIPSYGAPNTGGAVQTAAAALQSGTWNPSDAAIAAQPAPDPHLVNALSTVAMAIPFEGAAGAVEGGGAAQAEAIKNSMLSALEKAAPAKAAETPGAVAETSAVNEALGKAGVTAPEAAAPGEVPPVIKAPVIPIAPEAAPPSQAGFGNGITAGVGETLGQTVQSAGRGITKAVAWPSKFLNWVASKGHVSEGDITPYVLGPALAHFVPHVAGAIGVVKGLEKTGQMTEGLGDMMERLATADKTDPMGIFANAAENAPAGHWMKAFVKNPAVQLAIKGGTLAGGYVKGAAKGAAVGALMGIASGGTPEEIGESAGQMSTFGGVHGAMSAPQEKIFDANIGGVSKVVTDHFANGGSQATLQLVPASDILAAANLSRVLPSYTVKFATAADAGSVFSKPIMEGGAKGQAGFYEPGSKTLWIDPTKRAPGSTLIHEAFHPIFDEMVAQRPDIKATLDQALSRTGNTIEDFKRQYANRVVGASDKAPATPEAAQYIAASDAANPDWGYSEMLSESAAHNLQGKDLLAAMKGEDVQQSATQAALDGVQGWLSENGVDFKNGQTPGTIFPDFKDSFNDPPLRQLTYRLLKAQRESLYNKVPVEAPEVKLTPADMGGPKAPWYNVTDPKTGQPKEINPYGENVLNPKTGQKEFRAYPPSELRRRTKAEETALAKYFPEKTLVTTMPAGLMEDPAITPWTKKAIQTSFDAIGRNEKLSLWYHGIAGGKSATDKLSFAKRASRDLGNVPVSFQSGKSRGIERTSAGNFINRWESEEAENQLLAKMATGKGADSLDLWGGDQQKAKSDIQTYKQNHAAGLPGESNGLGIAKRDVINKMMKKTFRSLRLDRMESMTPEPSETPPANWEKIKANMSPAAEPAKREIELTGPDGKKYPAKYDGLQDDFKGGLPWIQVTPQVDLPGATGARSTTYAHSLLKKGYTLPQDLLDEVKAHVEANPAQPMQFSPAFNPIEEAKKRAEVAKRELKLVAFRDKETDNVYAGKTAQEALEDYAEMNPGKKFDLSKHEIGWLTNEGQYLSQDDVRKKFFSSNRAFSPSNDEPRRSYRAIERPSLEGSRDIEITGPNGKKYPATFISSSGTNNPRVKISPNVNLPNGPAKGSITYAHILEDAYGYKVPQGLSDFVKGANEAHPGAEWRPVISLRHWTSEDNSEHPTSWVPINTYNDHLIDYIEIRKEFTKPKLFRPGSEKVVYTLYGNPNKPSRNGKPIRESYQSLGDAKIAAKALYVAPDKPKGYKAPVAPEAPVAPLKITIGGKEYTHAELEQIVSANKPQSPAASIPFTAEEIAKESKEPLNAHTSALNSMIERLSAPKKFLAELNLPPEKPGQFSPSAKPNPKDIAAAAVKDEKTGKVYVGSSHGAATGQTPKARENLIDGFVTHGGEFLTRDQAYARAVAAKQYKPTDEDYNINRQLYGLTSERFNKQNPNTYYNVGIAEQALAVKQGKKIKKEKPRDYQKEYTDWQAKLAKKAKGNFSPSANQEIRDQAAEYSKEQGLTAKPHTDFARLDEDLGKRVADAYEAAPHIPDDPKVQASYKALADETRKQWDFLTNKGVTFEPWTKEGQPYANSAAMRDDVQQNKHLYFFPTAGGFGAEEGGRDFEDLTDTGPYEARPEPPGGWKPIEHVERTGYAIRVDGEHVFTGNSHKAAFDRARKAKLLTEDDWKGPRYEEGYITSAKRFVDRETGFKLGALGHREGMQDKKITASNNNPMLAPTGDPKAPVVNDMFRAVHDYFGHAKEGYEFGPRGEYNAYLAHSKMVSKAAIPALTAETMGQNSWVNFGKHLRDEAGNIPKKGEAGYKSPTERPYAAQKATALPDELTQESLNPKVQFSPGQPETISRAAVRVDKEHIFESDSHSGAYAKARKAGVMTEDDQGGPRTEEGFTTSAGRFVDRAEGYRLASAANQVNTREPALTDNGRWLDSSNVKAYSPAQKETEKLSYPMEMTPGHNTGVLPGLLKAPYDVRERYQADMLKAMGPLFAAFGAKPGATTKSSYKNSAGETEHNPMTKVEVAAQDAKLFGLLHGHFANQESVAGGFQETSPGKWEPVGPHSFDVQPTGGETFADKIKEMGSEAEDVLNKLQPVVGPAVEAVNKKYSGLHSHQLSPSDDPRAVKSAAVKDETTGKVYTGSYHGEAFEKYLAKNPGASLDVGEDEEDNGGIYGAPAHLTEGFVTNKGDFLDRQEALERAMEMKQYKDASPDKDYGLESVSFEHQKKMEAKPDQFSPSVESFAVKDPATGKIYTGEEHHDAWLQWFKENYPGKNPTDMAFLKSLPSPIKGYIMRGKFLTEKENYDRTFGQAMKQTRAALTDKRSEPFLGESSSDAQVRGHTWANKTQAEKDEWHKKNQAEWDKFVKESGAEPAPFVPTGVLKHHGNNPAKAAAAVADAKPGQPIALGTFSPPQMSDKAFEKLAGKKMLFVIGDQSNAGSMYKTEGGKEAVRMQGGPGYPTMPDTQGKAGWAFASKHLATRLAKAFKNVDYMAVFVGSPDMIAGAPSFSKAYLAELHEALASGQLKPGVLNRMARDAVRYAKTRSNGGNSIPTVHNFGELEQLLSHPFDRWNKDPLKRGLSFESRSIIIKQLGGVQSSKKFGTPAYRLVRDKYNDTGAFEQGQLAQIIKLHPDKPIGTAEEHDVPNYPDYPYVIPGTGLGQPSTKLMMADVLKPWTHTPKIAAQGGSLDYKVRMNMPETTINPAVFENK